MFERYHRVDKLDRARSRTFVSPLRISMKLRIAFRNEEGRLPAEVPTEGNDLWKHFQSLAGSFNYRETVTTLACLARIPKRQSNGFTELQLIRVSVSKREPDGHSVDSTTEGRNDRWKILFTGNGCHRSRPGSVLALLRESQSVLRGPSPFKSVETGLKLLAWK